MSGRDPELPGEPGEIVEDARGLLCPIPVIRLTERIERVSPGGTVLLLSDDPAAEEDVRLWCRGRGHRVEAVVREGRLARIRVRRAT